MGGCYGWLLWVVANWGVQSDGMTNFSFIFASSGRGQATRFGALDLHLSSAAADRTADRSAHAAAGRGQTQRPRVRQLRRYFGTPSRGFLGPRPPPSRVVRTYAAYVVYFFLGGGFWGFLFCLLPIRCNAQFFRPGVPPVARRPPLVSSPKKAPPPVAVRPGSMSKSSPAVASRRPPAAAAALAAALTGALSPPPAAAAAKKPAPTPAAAAAAAAAAAGTRTGSAMYAYNAADATQISVTGGEELTVVQSDSDWTFVENASGHRGYVPTSYLQL